MNSISKAFIIVFALMFTTAFTPTQTLQAAIFEGVKDAETDFTYGMCIGNPDPAVVPDCAGVDCTDPSFGTDVRCISEAVAGTGIAKGTLETTGITHTDDFGDFIRKLVNFSLPYLTLAAFVGYVFAGFLYVTAYGNDEQIQKAKKILIWSSVGLIVVILSFSIVQLLTKELVEGLK